MKKLLTIAGISLMSFSAFAQESIQILSKPWNEIMLQAQKENKSIFVDVTSASMMKPEMAAQLDKEVFSDETVKKLLSENYICARVNMGNKEESDAFMPYISGTMYPCYMMLHSNGDKLATSSPFGALKNKEAFINALRQAIEKSTVKRENNRKIIFQDISFEEARKKAKSENKLIFIDAMFEGCHWCTEMEKDTYTLNNVADFYNKNFICLKIDFLKNKEIAKAYPARGFPSYFYIDSNGKQLLLESGYTNNADKFIGYGKKAMEKK